MALNGLTVYLYPPMYRGSGLPFDGIIEYSRNETDRNLVRLRIIPDPLDASVIGEELTIRVMKARRDRIEDVTQAEVVYTFTSIPTAAGAEVVFDLNRIVYSSDHPFPMMRRGNYFFKIEHTGGPTGPSAVSATSPDFRVALMTTDRFENEWLKGATRSSFDDRAVSIQPQRVTGVWVVYVSVNHPLDAVPLNLVIGAETPPKKFLSWGAGELIELDLSIPGGIQKQYTLIDRNRSDYVRVVVDPLLLPNTNTSERVIVENSLISRETLRRWLDAEADWLEQSFLYTPLEPALCVSDDSLASLNPSTGGAQVLPLPQNFDYDLKGAPVTHFSATPGHWITLQVPFASPLVWDYLVGSLENARIIDVDPRWIHKCAARVIELVPYEQSLSFKYIGLVFTNSIWGPVELPSFWRYRYWAGIPEEKTPLELVEAIGLRAAIKALIVLGQMYRGGISSQSVNRDGVSETVSFTSSAMYGIYSATIEGYQKKIDMLLPQLKRKYFGIYIDVL
jgi:hypothetical protein